MKKVTLLFTVFFVLSYSYLLSINAFASNFVTVNVEMNAGFSDTKFYIDGMKITNLNGEGKPSAESPGDCFYAKKEGGHYSSQSMSIHKGYNGKIAGRYKLILTVSDFDRENRQSNSYEINISGNKDDIKYEIWSDGNKAFGRFEGGENGVSSGSSGSSKANQNAKIINGYKNDARNAYNTGMQKYQQKDYVNAYKYFDKAVGFWNSAAFYGLSSMDMFANMSNLSSGDNTESNRAISKRNECKDKMNISLAQKYEKQGDMNTAIRYYKEAGQFDYIIKYYLNKKQYDKAAEIYEKNKFDYYNAAVYYSKTIKFDKARDLVKKIAGNDKKAIIYALLEDEKECDKALVALRNQSGEKALKACLARAEFAQIKKNPLFIAYRYGIKVLLKSEQIQLFTPPTIEKGQVLVSAEELAYLLGLKVNISKDYRTLTGVGDNCTMKITEKNSSIEINGQKIKLSMPVHRLGGELIVPCEVIAKAFGMSYSWDNSTKIVKLVRLKSEFSIMRGNKKFTDSKEEVVLKDLDDNVKLVDTSEGDIKDRKWYVMKNQAWVELIEDRNKKSFDFKIPSSAISKNLDVSLKLMVYGGQSEKAITHKIKVKFLANIENQIYFDKNGDGNYSENEVVKNTIELQADEFKLKAIDSFKGYIESRKWYITERAQNSDAYVWKEISGLTPTQDNLIFTVKSENIIDSKVDPSKVYILIKETCENATMKDSKVSQIFVNIAITSISQCVVTGKNDLISKYLPGELFLTTKGEVKYNLVNVGELGKEVNEEALKELKDIVSIKSDNTHFVALKSDGTVWTWGVENNSYVGGLGRKTTKTYGYSEAGDLIPGMIQNLSGVVEIEAYKGRTLMLTNEGVIYISSILGVNKLLSGAKHIFSTTEKGYFLGEDDFLYSIDLGYVNKANKTILKNIVSVSGGIEGGSGEPYNFAVDSNGEVWAWGSNNMGQLGVNTEGKKVSTPIKIPGLNGIIDIKAFNYNNDKNEDGINYPVGGLALSKEGSVYIWGSKKGNLPQNSLPTKLTQINSIKLITRDLTFIDVNGRILTLDNYNSEVKYRYQTIGGS